MVWKKGRGLEMGGGSPHTSQVIGSFTQRKVWSAKKAKWSPSKMSLVTLPSQTNSFLLACQLDLLALRNVLLLIARTHSLSYESIIYLSVQLRIFVIYVFDFIVTILSFRTVCCPQVFTGVGRGGNVANRAVLVLRMGTEAWESHREWGYGRAMRKSHPHNQPLATTSHGRVTRMFYDSSQKRPSTYSHKPFGRGGNGETRHSLHSRDSPDKRE